MHRLTKSPARHLTPCTNNIIRPIVPRNARAAHRPWVADSVKVSKGAKF